MKVQYFRFFRRLICLFASVLVLAVPVQKVYGASADEGRCHHIA